MFPKLLNLKTSLCHQNVKEEPMKICVLASLALGLALASSTALSASDHAPKPPLRRHVAHFQVVELNPVDLRATAYAHPTFFPLFGQWASQPSAQDHSIVETEGLSRNPDDCVRWGCVGNN
jgi:hypothetical protein